MMKRFVTMVAVKVASQSGLVDLDIECDSILRVHIEIFLAVIQYVQYPTDHMHLMNGEKKRKIDSLIILFLQYKN